jgi:hypothetical protein
VANENPAQAGPGLDGGATPGCSIRGEFGKEGGRVEKRLTPQAALASLAGQSGRPFLTVLRHGTLEVEIYKPDRVDRQQPHTRDELYVVVSGTGWFVNGASRQPFAPGEVLFVPAGVPHRFEEFSDDFATWVFFYGPEGGERKPAE